MAAGLGFKDFTTGEVLTAADVDGYLMQGVWVFASAAARDAAVTSPQEGNFAYLKDTNVTTYYTGSAWANLDTTGMTNPMTTTGDMIYSSSGSTPARLGIGTTGQVLTVAGGVPSWATAISGGMTSLASGTLGASGTTLSGISGSYNNLQLVIKDYLSSTTARPRVRFNGITTATYDTTNTTAQTSFDISGTGDNPNTSGQGASYIMIVYNYASSVGWKNVTGASAIKAGFTGQWAGFANTITTAITQIEIFPSTGTISAGTYELFGVK